MRLSLNQTTPLAGQLVTCWSLVCAASRLVNRRQNWESIIDVQIRSIIDKNRVSTCWKVTEWPRPLLRQIEFRAMQTLPESKMADGEKKQIVLPLPNLRELRWNDVLTALNSACNEEIRHISTRKRIFCIEYWLLFLWIDRKCRDLVKLPPTESEKTKLRKWFLRVYFRWNWWLFGKMTNSVIDKCFQVLDNRGDIEIRAINRFCARSLQA